MAAVLEKASTVSVKGQTTMPVEVREVLGVGAGDKVTYRIEADGTVILRKAGEEADPALGAFLEFLADDLQRRPQAVREVTEELRSRLRRLTAETRLNRNERLEGESGL